MMFAAVVVLQQFKSEIIMCEYWVISHYCHLCTFDGCLLVAPQVSHFLRFAFPSIWLYSARAVIPSHYGNFNRPYLSFLLYTYLLTDYHVQHWHQPFDGVITIIAF